MSAVFTKMFLAYGLTIVVSMLVAVLIKVMTVVLGKMHPSAAAVPATSATSATPLAASGVNQAQGEIAAIAAAVYAMLGGSVRIVRIEPTSHGAVWTASGRLLHQTSHVIPRRSPFRLV